MTRTCRPTLAVSLLAGLALGTAANGQQNQDIPSFLQWFELDWRNMERRMPDFFLAGYSATWLPPTNQTLADQSVGYDPLDRFDLGRPGAPTAYGTEQNFRALVSEFHSANAFVYVDTIMNHNGFRRTDEGFHAEGGYSGFWANPPAGRDLQPTDDWGDFHNSPNPFAYLQSENPSAPNYNTVDGDLVALVDIDQFSNNQFIRQPVAEGDPQNIPAGTIRNRPNPANERFYPDRNATTPDLLNNPGTLRSPGDQLAVVYSFNPDVPGTPTTGTAITENASQYLGRWSQWMLEVIGIDGFRLDAAKHIPAQWWDREWDPFVHNRWEHPSGAMVTPYSFGESTLGNNQNYNDYIRRANGATRQGDEFGNRDALDLPNSGDLRNLLNSNGFGSWLTILNTSIDNEDGFNNGTLGVNHVYSHDNGSAGDGGSPPPIPSLRAMGPTEHTWVMLRTGVGLTYHNSRGITRPQNGFWPRQGVTLALGRDPVNNQLDDTFPTIVGIANEYARGDIDITSFSDPFQPNVNDVMVFERRQLGSVASLVVAVNDSRSTGVQSRNVTTNFAPGTRLHELTGNAADPIVDPNNQIPDVIVVDSNQRITITVPNKVSTAGEHEKGYVAYGPARPNASLSISGVTGQLPPEPFFFPEHARRINQIDIVSGPSVTLTVTTTQADLLDPNTDDNALFKIGQGYKDYNGNGSIDFPVGIADFNNDGTLLFPQEQTVTGGFEQFVDVNQPLFSNPGAVEGRYEQTIDASLLQEGMNYATIRVFRHRDAGDPIFRELRAAFYLDNVGPAIELVDPLAQSDSANVNFEVRALDRTTTKIARFLNLADGLDPVALAQSAASINQIDRFDWETSLVSVPEGQNTVTFVALEESGNATVLEHTFVIGDPPCPADQNGDGSVNGLDFGAWLSNFNAQDPRADVNLDGNINGLDFGAWLAAFNAGCE